MTNRILTLTDSLFQEAYICAPISNTSLRLQFKARSHNFHVELIPVHSPLLRKSYLVSYPPLTYMLKFSGFANLTSCLESLEWQEARPAQEESNCHKPHSCLQPRMLSKLAVAAEPYESNASGAPAHILRHKQSQQHAQKRQQLLEQQSIDTEAGMLSGMSQKHNMRSSPCRFTEFCNSQCLSHFAAPFIVDRTETSIAESCK